MDEFHNLEAFAQQGAGVESVFGVYVDVRSELDVGYPGAVLVRAIVEEGSDDDTRKL